MPPDLEQMPNLLDFVTHSRCGRSCVLISHTANDIFTSQTGVQRLRERLDALELPFPHHVEGFTREGPHFMSLSDFFVGKPGPGSISEAFVMGLPVIVERNASTMVQERYNTEWILQNHLGVVLRFFAEIAKAIELMQDQQQMARFRERINALNNRAVFEIPEMLDALIKQPSLAAPARSVQESSVLAEG
jgi:UDP-N-acetylglucosamine:LPS N-acetylglucosamine transferase